MKGNEVWTAMPAKEEWKTVPRKTREKSFSLKKEEHTQKRVTGTAAPVKSLTKDQPTPYREAVQRGTPYREAVQRGKQSPQMSPSQQMAKIKRDIQIVENPCMSLEGQPREGGRNSQHDFTNQTQLQGSDMPLRVDEEDNSRYSGNPTSKPFRYLSNIDSNSLQEGGLRLFPEAADPRQDTTSGGKEGQLSSSGHKPNSSTILEGVFQGTSSGSYSRLANTCSTISTTESDGNSEIKIPNKNSAEEEDIPNPERRDSLPTSSHGNRQKLLTDNQDKVTPPIDTHTCSTCNKTVHLNLKQHLKSAIHLRILQAATDRDRNADTGSTQLSSESASSLIYDQSLLQRIFNRPDITTLKSIPKNLRRNIATATKVLYHNCNNNIQLIQPHVELLIFLKTVLANMSLSETKNISSKKRRRAQTKYTKDRLDRWQLGGDDRRNLILNILRSPLDTSIRQPQTPASNMKRCLKLATQQGQYSKAVQALSSEGIVEPSTDTTRKLQNKHPLGQLPIPLDLSGVDPGQVHMEDITQALRSFPKDTACGRSGMRASHLMESLYLGTNLDTEFCSLTSGTDRHYARKV
jgi:hypothetical protein